MDKVYVEGMEFYGYHGVFEEENKLGQRFKVDLTAELDLSKAGKTDDLSYTINYAELYVQFRIVNGIRKVIRFSRFAQIQFGSQVYFEALAEFVFFFEHAVISVKLHTFHIYFIHNVRLLCSA